MTQSDQEIERVIERQKEEIYKDWGCEEPPHIEEEILEDVFAEFTEEL